MLLKLRQWYPHELWTIWSASHIADPRRHGTYWWSFSVTLLHQVFLANIWDVYPVLKSCCVSCSHLTSSIAQFLPGCNTSHLTLVSFWMRFFTSLLWPIELPLKGSFHIPSITSVWYHPWMCSVHSILLPGLITEILNGVSPSHVFWKASVVSGCQLVFTQLMPTN